MNEEIKPKRLVVGKVNQLQTTKGMTDYFAYSKLYGKTSFQVFCPNCGYGPMFTADTGLICERCGKKLIVVRMPGGDYKVEVLER